MKCIIRTASTVLKPGRIERVEDEEAERLVASRLAVYTKKEAWKKQKREKEPAEE